MLKKLALSAIVVTAFGLAAPTFSNAATFATYGDAYNNGAGFALTSGNSGYGGTYGGLKIGYSGTLNLSDITTLSADYTMLSGSFGAGSPRFSLEDQSGHEVYAYWGTPLGGGSFSNPVADGTQTNTGNYANLLSPDLRFYSNGFGGLNSPNTGLTWAQLVADVGSTAISWVYLDLDGGSSTNFQSLLVDNFTVNGDVFATPLPGALPLFATALGGLGLLGLRRRRKAQAAAA